MNLNILSEFDLVSRTYSEYLKLIKKYSNIKRLGIPVKYYNLNMEYSVVDEKTLASYKLYSTSGLKFDLYEKTPVFYFTPIMNVSASISDLTGQMMEGSSTVVVYTIKYPRISDLISFYWPVSKNREIFRVTNIKTNTGGLVTEPNVEFFELDLEYAPVLKLDNIAINEHYVYDDSAEKYYLYSEYIRKIQYLDQLDEKLNEIQPYYNIVLDLYTCDDYIVPALNELIIKIKRYFYKNYSRLFENIKYPFGYLKYLSDMDLDLINDEIVLLSLKTLELEIHTISNSPISVKLSELKNRYNQLFNIYSKIDSYQ